MSLSEALAEALEEQPNGSITAEHEGARAHVDVVHQQLKAQGVHVGAVHDHRDGTASFYFRDPEGNWLEMLYEPPGGIPSNQSEPAASND